MAPDHVLDPSGEVILVVRNPNTQIAVLSNEKCSNDIESSSEEDTGSESERPLKRARLPPKRSSVSRPQSKSHESGQQKPKEIRIQVSAKHLSLGSPVFTEMLTKDRKGGKSARGKGLVELALEGWDIDALLIVLYILHAQPHNIRHAAKLERLGVRLPREPARYSPEVVTAIFVSYYFRWPEQFGVLSQRCIEASPEEITSLGLPNPKPITDAMNSVRGNAITKVTNQIYSVRDSLIVDGPNSCSFECSCIMLGCLTRGMHSLGLELTKPTLPYHGISYRTLQDFQSCQSPLWSERKTKRGKDGFHAHTCSRSSLVKMFASAPPRVEGLYPYGADTLGAVWCIGAVGIALDTHQGM
ncbi:hypothetical protein BJY00DRAFT_311998 [Aspergillus carlsbadensis]|nr:hypothetical protein BJY00DRAFT_311998 [Aspergillus carlsbadensis]